MNLIGPCVCIWLTEALSVFPLLLLQAGRPPMEPERGGARWHKSMEANQSGFRLIVSEWGRPNDNRRGWWKCSPSIPLSTKLAGPWWWLRYYFSHRMPLGRHSNYTLLLESELMKKAMVSKPLGFFLNNDNNNMNNIFIRYLRLIFHHGFIHTLTTC